MAGYTPGKPRWLVLVFIKPINGVGWVAFSVRQNKKERLQVGRFLLS
jgi:hypothetical protein